MPDFTVQLYLPHFYLQIESAEFNIPARWNLIYYFVYFVIKTLLMQLIIDRLISDVPTFLVSELHLI